MKDIIKKLLRENLFKEEYVNDELYGYHVTSIKNLDSIKRQGLKIGVRTMQGNGLYAFYDYDHALRYARKGEIQNPIIIKFYVTNPNRFLYLNMGIAKQVLGNEYHLMTQIENYFYNGFDGFYEEVLKANPSMSIDKLKAELDKIENVNTENNQRTFVFSLIPSELNNRLNIVWDGNYGLEFRINNTHYVKVVGYDIPNFYGKETIKHEITFLHKIPMDSKFDELRNFLEQNPKLDNYAKVYNVIDKLYMDARNVRDFDYYDKLKDLLDEIK